jgi:hypothetical protein
MAAAAAAEFALRAPLLLATMVPMAMKRQKRRRVAPWWRN